MVRNFAPAKNATIFLHIRQCFFIGGKSGKIK